MSLSKSFLTIFEPLKELTGDELSKFVIIFYAIFNKVLNTLMAGI